MKNKKLIYHKLRSQKKGDPEGPNTTQKKKNFKRSKDDPLLKKKDRIPKFKK